MESGQCLSDLREHVKNVVKRVEANGPEEFHRFGSVFLGSERRKMRQSIQSLRGFLNSYERWRRTEDEIVLTRLRRSSKEHAVLRSHVKKLESSIKSGVDLLAAEIENRKRSEVVLPTAGAVGTVEVSVASVMERVKTLGVSLSLEYTPGAIPVDEIPKLGLLPDEDTEPACTLNSADFIVDLYLQPSGSVELASLLYTSSGKAYEEINAELTHSLRDPTNFAEFEEKIREIARVDKLMRGFPQELTRVYFPHVEKTLLEATKRERENHTEGQELDDICRRKGHGRATRSASGVRIEYMPRFLAMHSTQEKPFAAHLTMELIWDKIMFPTGECYKVTGGGDVATITMNEGVASKPINATLSLLLDPPVPTSLAALYKMESISGRSEPGREEPSKGYFAALQNILSEPQVQAGQKRKRGDTSDVGDGVTRDMMVMGTALKFSCPDRKHPALVLKRLHIGDLTHLHQILQIMRQQLVFNQLFSTCFCNNRIHVESDSYQTVEVSCEPPHAINLTLVNSETNNLITIEVAIDEGGEISASFGTAAGDASPCSSEYITELIRKTMSIPHPLSFVLHSQQ